MIPYYLLIPIIATLGPFTLNASRKCNVPYIISEFFRQSILLPLVRKTSFLLCPVLMECLAHQAYNLLSKRIIHFWFYPAYFLHLTNLLGIHYKY